MLHKQGRRKALGDDDGCFAAALSAVRTWGGVIEHPEASAAWDVFGLARPPRAGGWIAADSLGFTCCVDQGHYGHRARKATWLYAVGVPSLPDLKWGPAPVKARLDQGFHTKEEREKHRKLGQLRAVGENRIHRGECAATPVGFRDLLLSMAAVAVSPLRWSPLDFADVINVRPTL